MRPWCGTARVGLGAWRKSADVPGKKKARAANRWFLEPLGREDPETGTKKPAKWKKFICYDIESKDGYSQKAGFTRPFACGVYVPPGMGNESAPKRARKDKRVDPSGE